MKVMIADRSAIVRSILELNLTKQNDIQITASVSGCQKILNFVKSDKPDIVICGTDTDEESEKNALNTLCNELKIPVVILAPQENDYTPPFFSKLIATIEKPNLKGYSAEFFKSLKEKLSAMAANQPQPAAQLLKPLPKDKYSILCIGASTGGPTAVSEVLCGLGNNFPLPVLYTQHIDIDKDKDLADWLDVVCPNLKVRLARDGETALPGTVYMAPADRHLVIDYINAEGQPVLKLSDEEPERYLRPAVNKLFKSAARLYKNHTLAVLLTGMGADGAAGCKEICDKGGWTIVEDKSTCAVFGMPAAAIEAGGAKEVLPRTEISKRIIELAGK